MPRPHPPETEIPLAPASTAPPSALPSTGVPARIRVVVAVLLGLAAFALGAFVLRLSLGSFLWTIGPISIGVERASAPAGLAIGFLGLAALAALDATWLPGALRIPNLLLTLSLPILLPLQDKDKVCTALSILILILWAVEHISRGNAPRRASRADLPLLGYLGVQLVAALAADDVHRSLNTFFQTALPPAVVFFSVLWHTRERPETVRAFVIAIAVALGAVLLYGFIRFLLSAENHFMGFAGWYTRTGRFLNLTFPLLVGGLYLPGSRARRVASGLLLLATLVAIALTKSRGAYAGGAASLLFLSFAFDRRILFLPVAAVAALVLAAPRQLTDHALQLFHLSRYTESSETSPLKFRPAAWEFAVNAIAERPILGYGLESATFRSRFEKANPGAPPQHGISNPHNVFLAIAYESGLLGLSLFLAFLAAVARAGFRARSRRAPPGNAALATLLLAALLGVLVHGLVSHVTHDALALLIAIEAALIAGAESRAEAECAD